MVLTPTRKMRVRQEKSYDFNPLLTVQRGLDSNALRFQSQQPSDNKDAN